ncbi:MAG TPA: trigger factor [Mycobacteriales bacterium]|nr:trigger factor [Mycobacteriales bacterium]
MDVTTETLSPTRVRLSITVPFEELTPSIDQAYKKIAGQVRVPGFRPGKVPARVIDQRVGRAAVLSEALDGALGTFYTQAVEDAKVAAISRPEVDIQTFNDGEPLAFTAEVDIRPEFELPAYDTFEVTVDDAEVTDEDVQEQIDALRERGASLVVVDRPVEDGDVVRIDLKTTVDGEEVEGAQATGIAHEVGAGGLIPGLDEALVGATVGGDVTFTTPIEQGEHTGKEATVVATVHEVKGKELPELDDAFAAAHSQFETVDALRGDLRERLERMKKLQQGIEARDKVADLLLEKTDIPLPETVVEAEVGNLEHEVVHSLGHDDAAVARYLQMVGKTREEWTAQLREQAEKSVRTQLVLDAIAEKEEIGVSQEELSDQIVRRALRSGISPDEYARQVVEAGAVQSLAVDIRRGKALAVVLEGAKITDASGRPVDLEALRDDAPPIVAGPGDGHDDHEGHDHEGHDHA